MSILSETTTPHTHHGRFILLSILLAATAYLARFGYDYGFSDQDEFLPLLLRLIDGSAFASDWFVNGQLDGFNIRLPLVLTLLPFANMLGIPAAVFLVYVASFVFLCWAVFTISLYVADDRLTAMVSTVVTLAVTTVWTLGGNDIVSGMLVPSQVAWALGLSGAALVLKGRVIPPGVLCGLAVLFQPLVGIHLTLFCCFLRLLIVWKTLPNRSIALAIRSSIWLPITAILVASPSLSAIVFEQLNNQVSSESLLILTEFRAPHHFVPSAFNTTMAVRFGLLTVIGIGALWTGRRRIQPDRWFVLTGVLLFSAGLLAVGFINAGWIHNDMITKLQLFKFSVLLKMLWVAIIVNEGFNLVVGKRTEKASKVVSHVASILLAALLFAGVLAYGLSADNWTYRTIPAVSDRTDDSNRAEADHMDARLFDWISRRTSASAIFAIPPDLSGFQMASRRAQFVSFKAFPYHDNDIKEWYRRILAQSRYDKFESARTGMELPVVRGAAAMSEMSNLYESLSGPDIVDFATRESVDYVLRRRPIAHDSSGSALVEVYRNESWFVYDIQQSKENKE